MDRNRRSDAGERSAGPEAAMALHFGATADDVIELIHVYPHHGRSPQTGGALVHQRCEPAPVAVPASRFVSFACHDEVSCSELASSSGRLSSGHVDQTNRMTDRHSEVQTDPISFDNGKLPVTIGGRKAELSIVRRCPTRGAARSYRPELRRLRTVSSATCCQLTLPGCRCHSTMSPWTNAVSICA